MTCTVLRTQGVPWNAEYKIEDEAKLIQNLILGSET